MLHRRVHLLARSVLGVIAVAVITVLPAGLPGSGALAQTLTDPNPLPKWTPPASAKAKPAAAAKRCSAFGAGFVNVPGTDACVKVGGWVTVEGGASR